MSSWLIILVDTLFLFDVIWRSSALTPTIQPASREMCQPQKKRNLKWTTVHKATSCFNVKLKCAGVMPSDCSYQSLSAAFYKNSRLIGSRYVPRRKIKYRINLSPAHQDADDYCIGQYHCTISNKYGNITFWYKVKLIPGLSEFWPNDTEKIVKDKAYLHPTMGTFKRQKLLNVGSSLQLECLFLLPLEKSLSVSWYKHQSGSQFRHITTANLFRHQHQISPTMSSNCSNDNQFSGYYCLHSTLSIGQLNRFDEASYTCVLHSGSDQDKSPPDNKDLVEALYTRNILVDHFPAEKSTPVRFQFTRNDSICVGESFYLNCSSDDVTAILFLYKLDPNIKSDLKHILNLTSSLYIGSSYTENLYNSSNTPSISHLIKVAGLNHSGRYLCIIETYVANDFSLVREMTLLVSDCSYYAMILGHRISYITICIIAVVFVKICLVLVVVVSRYKRRNDQLRRRVPVRKQIVVEYESPIYSGLQTTDLYQGYHGNQHRRHHGNHHRLLLLPDSDPLRAPTIRIRPIKRPHNHQHKGPHNSTSTDRTRLESSTRISNNHLDNEVFDSVGGGGGIFNLTTSIDFDSVYDFPFDPKWEFSRDKLKVSSRKLGEGAFGMVYEGLAIGISDHDDSTKVAVKMMRDDFSDPNVFDFVKEMEIMKHIGCHPNVIELLGVCTQNGPLRVIVEYAPYGNLRDFLRGKNLGSSGSGSHGYSGISDNSNSFGDLNRFVLSLYSLQVAQGMAYLASRSIVHRDLSARNILVGENYEMKIADFGLTRIVDYYYRKKTDGILPVKWMAPEALLEKKYTTKSDVWSYGILLWEIFSLGESPYAGVLPDRVSEVVRRGVQNPHPVRASKAVYGVMQKCWSIIRDDRPHFYQLVELWHALMARLGYDDDEETFPAVRNIPEQGMQTSNNPYHNETLYLEMGQGYLVPIDSRQHLQSTLTSN